MATFRVQDGTITIGSAVGKILSADLNKTVSTMESTGGGDDWRERKPGYKDWSLSGTARFQGTLPSLGDEATCSLQVNDNTGAGQYLATGAGIVTSCNVSGDHENVFDMSFSIEGNGELTESDPTA